MDDELVRRPEVVRVGLGNIATYLVAHFEGVLEGQLELYGLELDRLWPTQFARLGSIYRSPQIEEKLFQAHADAASALAKALGAVLVDD